MEKKTPKSKPNGYWQMIRNKPVFTPYLTGRAKEDRDRILENRAKGIVSFDLL